MKAVSLSPRIRYFHCDGGEEGAHGVLVLLAGSGFPTQAIEIETQDDFKIEFENFRLIEQTQDSLGKIPALA